MADLKIEKVKIDDIKTYENNAKLHPAEQIEQIKKSIEKFGFNDPIAIDENNVIIEGHGRYIACKELDYKEIPCIRLIGLDEEKKKAYMLVHNKLTMNSGFDIELLSDELDSILNINMEDFGFDFNIDLDFDDVLADDNENDYDYSNSDIVTYEIVFNNKQEREQWYKYLDKLKDKYPDLDTISERIIKSIGEIKWAN